MGEPVIDEECKHGMVMAWCSLCRPRRPAPKEHIERTFSARFHSRCPDCRELIEPGDVVHMLMPSGNVIHEDCS